MFCNTNRITGQRGVMGINWDRNKSGGKPFSLGERKRFLSDTTKFKQTNIPDLSKIKQRLGVGNRSLVRPAFISPNVKGRDPVDFDKMRAVNIAQFGTKVQLSDETIDKLIKFQAPDDRDREWIAEKARLVGLGKGNELPLGRRQRMISKTVNFGKASLTFNERMSEISAAVQQGVASNLVNRQILGVEIAKILSSAELTQEAVVDLEEAIKVIKVPIDWNNQFKHRFWTVRQMSTEIYSAIMLYSLSNLPVGRTIATPVVDRRSGVAVLISASKFSKIIRGSKGGGNTVYDLGTRTLYDVSEVLGDVMGGVDGGFLDDMNFQEFDVLSNAITGNFQRKETIAELRRRLTESGRIATFEATTVEEEDEDEVKEE